LLGTAWEEDEEEAEEDVLGCGGREVGFGGMRFAASRSYTKRLEV
jgi:hypothetical protein